MGEVGHSRAAGVSGEDGLEDRDVVTGDTQIGPQLAVDVASHHPRAVGEDLPQAAVDLIGAGHDPRILRIRSYCQAVL